jgi:hypothetical protein
MTPEEIESGLGADEPAALRRHLELHRERLEERFAGQLRKLRGVERFLAIGRFRRMPATPGEADVRGRPQRLDHRVRGPSRSGRTLASDGAGVSVVVGKAGTGKSTAIGAYRAALDAAGIPVVGVAPSATAAHQLARSAGIRDTATVDRLLVEIEHGHRRVPPGVVVVLDEPAMCPTRTRLRLQQPVDVVGGKVVDVGDHRQIPSVDVGGGHYALAQRLGATILGTNHRFRDPVYRDAAELLRDRQPVAALDLLRRQGAVSDQYDQPVEAWTAMVDDWLAHRDRGDKVLMLATKRATVSQLNHLARAHLRQRADVATRSRAYLAADGRREIRLAVGDEVILRRNDNLLPQANGRTAAVRNGMTGRVTRGDRRGVTVRLDPDHRSTQAEVVLPASYVGEHVDYGYARRVDIAQGATVDHSLFTPSVSTSAERVRRTVPRPPRQPHLRHPRPRLDRRHQRSPRPHLRHRPATRPDRRPDHPPRYVTPATLVDRRPSNARQGARARPRPRPPPPPKA